MSWRNFKTFTPIDKRDKRDKSPCDMPDSNMVPPPEKPFVDIVDIVDRSKSSKIHHEVSNRLSPTLGVIVKPDPSVCAIWRNTYPQGSPEAREDSLHQVIMAILEPTFDRITAIWPQGFVSTPEIRAAELEIEKLQTLVLSGKAKITDFRKSAEEWVQICKKEISGLKN